MGDDTEWLKLSTDDKCVHKAWKARLAGYEEATKLFKIQDSEKSPEFSKFLGIIKKFVVDNNAIAQEKGLDAVLAFVENAHVAGKTTSEVVGGVILKCLNASRPKTKERGIEIIMMYIEIEKQEIVQEELIKGLGNKQPKVVAGCVLCLREALRDFGSKVITIKPLVKQLQKILEDRDKTVREEAKQLAIEIYRWIGNALRPQLANLKPVQVTELEAEFENIPPGSARQSRFLRSQQDLKAKMEEQAAAEGAEGGAVDQDVGDGAVAEEIDPYDLMDPVDILAKIPKDYWDKVEAKKWQERKEALEAVLKLTENPKLEPSGSYHDLVKTLTKVIAKDTNVMLVAIAAKCIAGLANGLRKKFSSLAGMSTEALLEKFKEKKLTVVTALREAIDAVYLTTSLEPISELCIEALGHKTPTVKAETASFLARCFTRCTTATLPKKMLKAFVAPLLKLVSESMADVREAAYNALGTAMKVVQEKAMLPFLADIDALKMAKIKEYCDKAEVVGKSGQAKSAPAAAPAAAAKPVVVKPGAKPKGESSSTASSESGPPSKPGGAVRPKTAPAKPGAAKKGAKGKKSPDTEEKVEAHISDEVVEEKMTEMLSAETIAGLASTNWKERLAAIEKFTMLVKGMSKSEIPCQACVRTITKKPGLKENNFQVLKLKVELLGHLALNSNFSKTSASFCLIDLVDKVGDVKNGGSVKETLSCIAEATSLEYVGEEVISQAFTQKNPKNQSESLVWLSKSLMEFGFKVKVKPILENLKKALAATNPAVRMAAVSVLGVLYMHMGPPLRVLFDGEKAALLQQIDAEFEKVKGEKPPPPTRGVKAGSPGAAGGGGGGHEEDEDEDGGGGGGDDGAAEVNIADLVPRNDISEQLKEEIMNEMADKNWKVRKEALEKVISILNEAKFITPSIGPLPESLKLRLGDSNKILVTMTLGICQTLATAMGPNIKQHIRVVGPGLVACLGDSKPALRTTAVTTINAWVEQTGQAGFIQFVEGEIFADALKLENPFLRAELLGWLAEKMPAYRKLPTELNVCIPYLFACLEDRNGDVRKKAQEALLPFMIHVGYESMFRKAGKLKPASKDTVLGMLEKAKANLPAKPPPKAKAAPAKAAAPAAAATKPPSPQASAPSSEPEDEPERPATAPAGAPGKGKGKVPAGKKGAPVPARKKNEKEEDTSPPLRALNKAKEQRFKDEKSLKCLKWNFTAPRAEYLDQLKQQMEPAFNKTLQEQLFHADFKNHIKAIDTLRGVVEECDGTIANLDLLLKWVTLRFFDTNTTVLIKSLDYLKDVFGMLSSQDYHLLELEATCFVPYLINKVGDPKDNVRKDIRELFRLVCKVYPASKMFSYIIDGLKSKNSKQRTECLDELGNLIEVYGINVCQPAPAQALKMIAQQIGDRDNSVRSAALNTIVTAYGILGEAVHKYIGPLKDKDAGMLEERIKRSAGRTKSTVSTPGKSSPEEKPTKNARMPPPEQHSQPEVLRPKSLKKEYLLDFDYNESMVVPEVPKFNEVDVEDVLSEPILLPETKSALLPASPSMKLLNTSSDVQAALDLVITQIASNDINTSIQALAQIDGVLTDEDKCDAMSSHVEQFLVACTLKLRMAYSKHMSDQDAGQGQAIRLYKCLLGSLLTLTDCKNLAKEASRDVLGDLVQNLVTVLLDNRLNDMAEGTQVIRSVNIMIVRIVVKSDPTCIMSALIKLLHEAVQTETTSFKFQDMIMKGLWKMIRMLPEIINDLNLDKIIGDLHTFLKAFPSHTWKQRPNDLPLRTTKTILHSLAKLKGPKIMSHLVQVDSPNSEVEAYLRKVLKNGFDANNVATINKENEQMNQNGTPEVELRKDKREGSAKSSSAKRLSKSIHDTLAVIFKKIGSKENTREGLNDLYDFKQRCPDADLEPFLKKSSQFFQSYIERGLKNIEIEREGKMKTSASAPEMSSQNDTSAASRLESAADDLNTAVYHDRLKALRARCGLDNGGGDLPAASSNTTTTILKSRAAALDGQGSSSSLSSTSSGGGLSMNSTENYAENSITSNTSRLAAGSPAPTEMDDLRKRLQRIKKVANI